MVLKKSSSTEGKKGGGGQQAYYEKLLKKDLFGKGEKDWRIKNVGSEEGQDIIPREKNRCKKEKRGTYHLITRVRKRKDE